MAHDSAPNELVDCVADQRLLDEDVASLPAAVGQPEAIVPSATRGRVVGLGATLTGLTLLVGIGLMVVGAIEAASNGLHLVEIGMLALGLLLIGTHWGWVHVAEVTADAIEGRRNSAVLARRHQWLATIQPFTRHEVTTSVADDGSISIVCVRVRPVRSGKGTFTFVREPAGREVHSGDAPGAEVAERAELLRRQAAIETERERQRFEVAADAHETAMLVRGDAQERAAPRRAASQALSEQINSNLRDPPLVE